MQEQRHVSVFAFFLFDLCYVMQETRQKILLSFWNKVLFCQMFVLLLVILFIFFYLQLMNTKPYKIRTCQENDTK